MRWLIIGNSFLAGSNLVRVLNKINFESKRLQYTSKWHSIVNFLYNNTGFTIARVAKGGSIAKHTHYGSSDLDVIFCTSPDRKKEEILDLITEKAEQNYGDLAYIRKGERAVHIDFADCPIDVVYLTQNEFDREKFEIKKFSKFTEYQEHAIKIAKYGFDRLMKGKIKGYEIEKAGLQFNGNDVFSVLMQILYYFSGRIKEEGCTIGKIQDKIISPSLLNVQI